MANIYEPVFDEPREHDGYRARRARLGHQVGTRRVGLSLWEIPPGEAAYPYHFHLAEEEVLIVLDGSPVLRTPEGRRRVARGEVVAFGLGEQSAHQLLNDTRQTVRFLAVSSQDATDIALYPDEGKIGVADRDAAGSGLKKFFNLADEAGYWAGIGAPEMGDVDPA